MLAAGSAAGAAGFFFLPLSLDGLATTNTAAKARRKSAARIVNRVADVKPASQISIACKIWERRESLLLKSG